MLDGIEPEASRQQRQRQLDDAEDNIVPTSLISKTPISTPASNLTQNITLNLSDNRFETKHFQEAVGSVDNRGCETNVAGAVQGNQIGTQSDNGRALAAVAGEIQQLLGQLAQIYPTGTVSEQQFFIDAVVKAIEARPELKARVVTLVERVGTEALKAALKAAIDGVAIDGVAIDGVAIDGFIVDRFIVDGVGGAIAKLA